MPSRSLPGTSRLSRPGAGGEQELAVRQPVAVDLELMRLGVDALDGRLEHDLDPMVGVELLVLDDRLLVGLAAEELLRSGGRWWQPSPREGEIDPP